MFSITGYIYLAIGAAFLALSVYCKILSSEVDTLTSEKAMVVAINNQQKNALDLCTASTEMLKAAEIEITSKAQVALETAKKDAVNDYKRSSEILLRKAKLPVITKKNEVNFGGSDPLFREKDYLQTQELINEAIDTRNNK